MTREYAEQDLLDKIERLETEAKVQAVKLEAVNLEVERHQKLSGLYAQIVHNNIMLEEQMMMSLSGLGEIQAIKGEPPIQVARTIATRTIADIAKHIAKDTLRNENQNNGDPNATSSGPDAPAQDPEHEGVHVASRIG